MINSKAIKTRAFIKMVLVSLVLFITTIFPISFFDKVSSKEALDIDLGQSALSIEQVIQQFGEALNYSEKKLMETVRSLTEKKVPILTYHHFVTEPSKENELSISPNKFKSDLLALKLAGYETVFVQDLIDYVNNGTKLPEKPIVITIDDGYSSNYEYAFPILEELGMKATIFVIGWSVGERKYKDTDQDIIPHFSWEEAKKMVQSGLIDIQNHSYDMHESDARKAPYRKGVLQRKEETIEAYKSALTEDTLKLQELIKSNLGYEATVFAYPYGEYSLLSENVLTDIGFKVTLTTKKGVNIIRWKKPESLYALKRFNVGPDISSEDLVKLIEY